MKTEGRHSAMQMRFSLWIEDGSGGVLYGSGRQQILQAIEKHGTLTAAAKVLGMSYRGLWARVRNSEKRLGFPLIETRAGRSPSSGTTLTPKAKKMIDQYEQWQRQVEKTAMKSFQEIFPQEASAKDPA